MGRKKGPNIVNIEAQDSKAVGQQQTDNGNSGWSLLDLDAPQSQPRHSRSGETRCSQGKSTRPLSSNCTEVSVQSPARDNLDGANSTSVMPPPSQRRLNRSATAPLEERRRYSIDEDDREEKRLPLVRRHTERHESPPRARRQQQTSPSMTDSETYSHSESEHSFESEASGQIRTSRTRIDVNEEADDEAPPRQTRRSNGPELSRRRGKAPASYRDTTRSHSSSDQEPNVNEHRELIVRDDQSFGHLSDPEHELSPPITSRHQRRSAKASGAHRARHSSERSHRRGQPSTKALAREAPQPQRSSTRDSSRSSSASLRRPTNVLGGLLAGMPSKKHTKHAASSSTPKGMTAHAERVECVICMCDVSIRKAAHLKCDHYMCNACLKRAFVLSVEDSTHMPPRCCTKDHIQPKHVERLFDWTFKRTWNRKFVEYTTKNRLYCPAKRCGHFIKPSRIKLEKGRKYARCGHCDTKVCAKCNNRWHKTVDCPQDQSINDFLAQAKEEGWQRCYQCKAMVELREGCNHMTCRCGAEFCMICGTKWKSCDCPWFNDEAIAADRRRHLNEGLPPPRGGIDDIFHGEGPPIPPELRGMPGFGPAPFPMMPLTHNYLGEHRLDARTLPERDNADLVRNLPIYSNLDADYVTEAYDTRGISTVLGVGNTSTHHMPHHYHRGSQSVSGGSVPPMPAQYDRASVTDYVSDVSRARGVREDSMERRLAERLAERPAVPPTPLHHTSAPSMGAFPSVPTTYSYPGIPSSGSVVNPATVMPVMMQSYPYSTPPIAMDTRYSAVHSSPSHLSMPSYEECYDQRAVEVNTSRRRRRAHERERAAETHRQRRMSASAVAAPVEEVKSSSMAGLTGPGRGMDRVAEWSYHVSPGMPASTVGDGR